MVTDALNAGDDVGGHQHGDAPFGDHGHQRADETRAGDAVDAGQRLVQHQQVRPFAESQRERQPGALYDGRRGDLRGCGERRRAPQPTGARLAAMSSRRRW